MRRSSIGLFAVILAVSAALPIAAQTTLQGTEHCVVNVGTDDPLNLRAGPGTHHQVLSRLAYASCGLVVTGPCKGSWCPVEDGHYAGWVNRHFIAAVSEPDYCVTSPVKHRNLTMRAWPSDSSRVLTQLKPAMCGIALLPYEVRGWKKIRLGGWEGWVRGSAIAQQN